MSDHKRSQLLFISKFSSNLNVLYQDDVYFNSIIPTSIRAHFFTIIENCQILTYNSYEIPCQTCPFYMSNKYHSEKECEMRIFYIMIALLYNTNNITRLSHYIYTLGVSSIHAPSSNTHADMDIYTQ